MQKACCNIASLVDLKFLQVEGRAKLCWGADEFYGVAENSKL